jgi:hypothetical protein
MPTNLKKNFAIKISIFMTILIIYANWGRPTESDFPLNLMELLHVADIGRVVIAGDAGTAILFAASGGAIPH